jgi:Fe-S cluster assembly protein SufD
MTLEDTRFTLEQVVALGGPNWLQSYREHALLRLEQVTPATERVEEWRYGRIDDLDLSRYELFSSPTLATDEIGDRAQHFLSGVGEYSCLVRLVNGRIVSIVKDEEITKLNIEINSLEVQSEVTPGFGELLSQVDEPFAVLNDAMVRDALIIDVPSGAYLSRPIVVISELSDEVSNKLSFSRILVRLGETAEASVVVFQSSSEAELLHIPVTEVVLGNGAQLRFDQVQHLGTRAWQLGYQLALLGRDSSLTSFAAALGGDYSRLYSWSKLVGENAESKLFAAYLGVDTQVQEFRTFQDHVVGRTKSDLVFKGAVADHARSVYSGMIHMHKGARRAEASQTNRNLVLSEGAHADSVPNLDIEENDVRCSHASAVGPIDPEQRFYLESRGISPDVAERLILLGFFDDLLAKANNEGSAKYVRTIVAERLLLTSPILLAS